MTARILGALRQIEADGVIVPGRAIELKPEYVGRNLGDALNRRTADRAERVQGCARFCAARARFSSAPGQTIAGPPIGDTPIGAE